MGDDDDARSYRRAGWGGAGAPAAAERADAHRRAEASQRLLACLQSCSTVTEDTSDGGGGGGRPGDIHSMVEQRRTDLAIAGELGQALLDKSAWLSEQGDSIRQRYSSEAEALLSDNGKLRRRLAQVEEELQASRQEHDAAIGATKRRLSQQREAATLAQREGLRSSELLQQQNERLSAELQAISAKEPRLRSEAAKLRGDVAQRRRAADELRHTLDDLADQNTFLRAKQTLLEASCRQASEETNDADAVCTQLQQKAAWLERKNVSLSEQVTTAARQLNDLQKQIAALETELENSSASDPEVFSSDVRGQSLLEELEISQRSITSGYESTQSIDDDFDKLDCGHSAQLSPTLPLDPYGQLQVEVHDSIEMLKQACSSIAVFFDESAISGEEEADFRDMDGNHVLPGNAAAATPFGARLTSTINQVKRFTRELVAEAKQMSCNLSAADTDKLEQELAAKIHDLRAECSTLAEAAARDAGRCAQLQRERDEARSACDETLPDLLRVKGELMERGNELLETSQARLKLARLQDLWMADMAEVVKTRVESQLQSESASRVHQPIPAKKTGLRIFR